ncbi:hypothetical protein WH218_06720 [Stenotrophomonas indicatrix]|uniref:fimbrial protein n=1 Tax=Stenotrophomonas indicatrix TaxID=2045451 RepID=UPI0015E00D78|nr:hypothetical protein [Stenotrophomonas indicatrix]MBA0098754.1 hypothetical protein [Stenotrophomonas indicatrix]
MKAQLLILSGLTALAGNATAQNGTISFDGEVAVYSCVVSADGNANSGDATVPLPTITSPAMVSPGSRAGMRHFKLVVGSASQPCEAAAVSAHWLATGGLVDQDTGRLKNQAGPGMATGVQVVLLNDVQQDIDLRNDGNSQTIAFDNGVATLDYHGEYYATGGLREGDVNTSVQYELDYR